MDDGKSGESYGNAKKEPKSIKYKNMSSLKSICIILLLFLGGIFFKTARAQSSDTLSFLHITDTHLIFNPDGYLDDLIDNRKLKHYDEGERRLREFFQTIPEKANCDIVTLTGDLVDFFEAETAQGEILGLQQEQFAQLIGEYHLSIYLTLGNHDIFSFSWEGDRLKHNQNFSGRSRAAWVRNVPCFKNGTYYSEVFQVGQTAYRLIFLDDSFYQFLRNDSTNVPYIDKAQLYWLNNQLEASEDDVEIILMHIPLINTKKHRLATNELYNALSTRASCKLILAGHQHKNTVKTFSSVGDNKIVQVQTGALVWGEENWRKVSLTEKNILVSLPGKLENELIIPVR